ncbi:hypothetical protein [Rhodoplanes roseus]|uniref:Uncharacterized protein n=1 Tax=Rhodoplanes roseus TaxID=29409 RepID=A0A327KK98_9BRAD|nr:hypothetical protein [Rhodoplanes roseus]RAI39240.1 hypothetical protein CH341_26245 [Rhodoplanes roseus]
MHAPKKPEGDPTPADTFTLGRGRLAKISAVEGIETSPESREMFAEFEGRGLSPEQRRAAIYEKHTRKV